MVRDLLDISRIAGFHRQGIRGRAVGWYSKPLIVPPMEASDATAGRVFWGPISETVKKNIHNIFGLIVVFNQGVDGQIMGAQGLPLLVQFVQEVVVEIVAQAVAVGGDEPAVAGPDDR